ncbi:deoxyribodipyrimidine photo-lyase [Salinicola sp. MH3R3-1]|uniref:deoxyribodipyrimidine photo-lyase n=1 Tax=Salinicola sp. MH3R3-1 TaxID=1928762 RepID=UPI00094E4B0C|nr:deoxyribodipyrimidine photo-lyase [Salinicola sp. MH3R3-1]OLO08904.1 deoxyribodipyrimidine photo-lyase [Salinicola sp. MH3R3-1]
MAAKHPASSTQLVWFRNDLRTLDHSALSAAAEKGPVIGIFLACRSQWRGHGHGANKISFLHRGVVALQGELAELGIPLLYRDIGDFEAAPKALLKAARDVDAQALHFNREYPLDERSRDEKVAAEFARANLAVFDYTDHIAFEPGELLTGQDDYYKVFTPFAKAWHQRVGGEQLALRETPSRQTRPDISGDNIPDLPNQDRSEIVPTEPSRNTGSSRKTESSSDDGPSWPVGQEAAADRLARFLQQRARRYDNDRDFPALAGTSELSAYLSAGMISYRQCLQAVMANNGGHLGDGDAGLTSWTNELVWREFYQHIAVGFPRVCRYRPFKPETDKLSWRYSDKEFDAWCQGRTGFPLVDAAMRQLVATGWMHNRLRMVTAMFLSKHLLLDWRRGEAFFMQHLVDGDFASNNGGWQWAASTGTDAAPYFRIFNPTTQSRRFDPDAEFITRWLPELAELPVKSRHQPSPDQRRQTGYPQAIVDHRRARERALEAFKSLG